MLAGKHTMMKNKLVWPRHGPSETLDNPCQGVQPLKCQVRIYLWVAEQGESHNSLILVSLLSTLRQTTTAFALMVLQLTILETHVILSRNMTVHYLRNWLMTAPTKQTASLQIYIHTLILERRHLIQVALLKNVILYLFNTCARLTSQSCLQKGQKRFRRVVLQYSRVLFFLPSSRIE
jgi:hypothetical protein